MAGISSFNDKIRPLFETHGRPKKNNVKDLKLPAKGNQHRKRAERLIQGAPEVMVKITGHARGAKHLRRLLQYITRDGELTAATESSENITGKEAVAELANDWNATSGKRRLNTRDTVNIVLSMPATTDEKAVWHAAVDLAQREFSANYDYAMVLHTPETDPSPQPSPNPHVHLVVKSLGHDGKRLNPRKADLQRWRELFAERLIAYGVEAEATPRFVRGVVKKPARRPVHHVQKREPRSQRLESAVREVAAEIAGRAPVRERPWETAIRTKQDMVRAIWIDAARTLEASPELADKVLAKEVRAFVSRMPTVKTERDEIADRLRDQLTERLRTHNHQDHDLER